MFKSTIFWILSPCVTVTCDVTVVLGLTEQRADFDALPGLKSQQELRLTQTTRPLKWTTVPAYKHRRGIDFGQRMSDSLTGDDMPPFRLLLLDFYS